jgi:potassium-dependent mechanosensitive channel
MPIFNTIVGALNGTAAQLMNRFVLALVILFAGFVIARILGILAMLLLKELNLNALILKLSGVKLSVEEMLSGLITYSIYLGTVILALNQIGLTTKLVYTLAVSVFVIVLISIFIALKDFVPNLIAGFYILHKGYVKVGDRVSIDNTEGVIKEINMLESRIETKEKDSLLIANSSLVNKLVKIIKN